MSTYREGRLALAAARSLLPACDVILLLEGAIREAAPGGDPTPTADILDLDPHNVYVEIDGGIYDSDADKRTSLLSWAQAFAGTQPFWCIWLDGDELLMFGEYLPDHIARAEHEDAAGFPLRIVEFDGSVAKAPCRVFRGDLISRCLEGAYVVEARNGLTVAMPNIKVCDAGGVPWKNGGGVVLEDLVELRPPLAGEPHILHRTVLRNPQRTARRIHDDEVALYADHAKGAQ